MTDIYQDMNGSWSQPRETDGYRFFSAHAQGAYLRVEFRKRFETEAPEPIREEHIVVFVNDMGREVARTIHMNEYYLPGRIVSDPVVNKISRWTRFKNGFFLVLVGLDQIIHFWRR